MHEHSGLSTAEADRIRKIRICWIFGVLICLLYLLIVYLFPLQEISSSPIIPLKSLIEIILCSFPLVRGFSWLIHTIRNQKIDIRFDEEFAILELGRSAIVTCCFEIESVNTKVAFDDNNHPIYDTGMLLALRSGMAECSTMTFEAGVLQDTPYLRIYLTATGKSLSDTCEIVKREATRTEAILLASISNIEIKLLYDDDLRRAYFEHIKLDDENVIPNDDSCNSLLVFDGLPRVIPSIDRSQIGTLLSSLLKQKYSASFACVFSKASAKKEKRKMERKWKSIRQKEKTKDDSLSDQAVKKELLGQYDDVLYEGTWFDTTAYLHVNEQASPTNIDALKGLALSIWGGDGNLKLNERKLKGRTFYRHISRRHLKKIRMHANKLAAYVNMPIQNLPVITSVPIPSFSIPSNDLIGHELKIAKSVFEGHVLNDVGLKIEWIREHIAVLGATGTGKTTLVKHLIAELSKKTSIPWWIFDVKGSEYRELMRYDNVLVINPGLDSSFVIDVFDSEEDSEKRHASVVFSILRELLKERSNLSELTPAMERLLRETIDEVVRERKNNSNSMQKLFDKIDEFVSDDDRSKKMTRDALVNRLEILRREPLGSILSGGKNAVKISGLMNRRVVFDLRYVANTGGMDAARLLYNLVAKRIFDFAMRRGITPDLRHVVVLEEASNLVPESYTRGSAADITTGESMVMLQRATGQGVVAISTRPNISSNILANTSTKITFRLPYDSEIGGRFLSLNDDQEKYLRVLKRGHAIIVLPNTNAFEIVTQPFAIERIDDDRIPDRPELDTSAFPEIDFTEHKEKLTKDESTAYKEKHVFDRIGEISSHITAYLATERYATEKSLTSFLKSLDSQSDVEEISELIRDLLSIGTIEREAIPLVDNGIIYTIPGKGSSAIIDIIMEYIMNNIDTEDVVVDKKSDCEIIINDRAFYILPEHLRASSMNSVIKSIRSQMTVLGNQVDELIIIVRGSVAATMLRELLNHHDDEFEAVTVVAAFASSLDAILESFKVSSSQTEKSDQKEQIIEEKITHTELINAVHELGSSSGRAIQMQLWFGLLQDFVDVSNGCVRWDILIEFIENTAMQSIQGKSTPMNIDDGRRALTELLADEVLVALRIGEDRQFIDLESGLWIVNSSILENLKMKSIETLEKVLKNNNAIVSRNHGYYDLCAGNKSYVVFPTQQQLNTLLNLHSEIACRKCNSTEVIVILTAAEYLDDKYVTPENLRLGTMADNMATLFI